MTKVIFLENVNKFAIGQEAIVSPGFARNFLLPKGKALRATKENQTYFANKRAELEAANSDKKTQAAESANQIENSTVTLVRQAGEDGRLFGSVTSRDIANAISESKKIQLSRSAVELNDPIKAIGTYQVKIALHAEVIVMINVNITRSDDKLNDD